MRKIALSLPRVFGAAILLIALLPAAPRPAAAQDAAAFINNLGHQGLQVLGPSVPAEQRAAFFRRIFESDFDMQDAARFVLGPNARNLSPEQQQEFTRLFREYLVKAYTTRLAQYGGQQFQVTGVRPAGGEEVVSSQVIRQGGGPVTIDWHVVNRGRWLITDVVVDGVSMKVTHRNEFASIIQRNGGRPDSLLAALRQQLAEGQTTRSGTSAPPSPYPAR